MNLEYIFIDGFSADKTAQVVASKKGLVDRFLSEPDLGIYDAMNKGLGMASGEVIGILNSDDFYTSSDVLKQVVSAFEADPTIEVVMGGVELISEKYPERVIRTISPTRFSPWMFRFGFMPPHPGVFVRKSTYERLGGYKLKYKIASDFDFLIRSLYVGRTKFVTTEKIWVRMRIGGVSTAGWRSTRLITEEMLSALRENGIVSCTLFLLLRLPIKFFSQVR